MAREMKSYLSLIPISAKNRRKQNRLILLCIIFAVFLVTTVFSYAEIMVKGQTEGMIRHHGSHHIVISGLSEAEAEQIAGRDDVSAAAWCNALGEDVFEGYHINDTRVILYGAEADYIDDIRAYEREGAFPKNDGDIDENLATMGAAGVSSNQTMGNFYLLAVIVFVLILLAGVLMIASCLNSTVAQRTKFFGMMRCIGASREQVMRFVRLEALNWCKTAIPAGLVISVVFTYALSMILQYKVGGEFEDYRYRFSVAGIVSGILVGVISVLLAAHSPARRAAGVSPVAAVSGNAESGKTVSRAANTRVLKVEHALGVYHAAAAKKNLVLMSLSFAFTVVLFLVFSAGLDLMKRLVPSESDLNPDISVAAADSANSIDKGVKEEIAGLPGVESVLGCAICYDTPAEINGAPGSVDLISYDSFMFDWTKNAIASGELEQVSGDTDYIMLGANFTKDASDETIDEIREIVGENELVDRREENQTVNSSFWVFRIAAYGFLAVIVLITVFNIMNNVSMSVSARMKQYGAMRAVGMSAAQMTRIIAAEAATYAVSGLFFGYIIGLYLHRLFMVKIVFTHFGGSWKIPWDSLTIITLIVAMSCVAAVRAPARRIREMSITETINEL